MRAIRTAAWLTAVSLMAAACSGTALPTTTTEATTTTVASVTTLGRITLIPNGSPLIRQGDRGAYVEALQFYLVCTNHQEPIPGSQVSVDGSYGPITSKAVAYYQAELRRVPSGEPDEETFASLARDCTQSRALALGDGVFATEIAGNASAEDPETYTFTGAGGQILSFDAVDGVVTITVFAADGTEVVTTQSGTRTEADLVTAQTYSIQIVASAPTTYRLGVQLRSPNVVVAQFGPMKLAPDGIGMATFGNGSVDTIALITLVLGSAMDDTDWIEEAGCTGKNRHVTWLIQGDATGNNHPAAFTAHFTDTGGTPYFSEYAYVSRSLAALDPLARGLATPEGLSLGSTYTEFVDIHGVPTFEGTTGLTRKGEVLFGFDLVGGTTDPDGTASRIRLIGAGADGCPDR